MVGRSRSLAGPGVQVTSRSPPGAALGCVNLPTRTPPAPIGAASSLPCVKGVIEWSPRGVNAIRKGYEKPPPTVCAIAGFSEGYAEWKRGSPAGGWIGSRYRAEAVVVQVVVVDHDQILVCQLRHEMERLALAKRRHQRFPVTAVRPDRPESPHPAVATALRLE